MAGRKQRQAASKRANGGLLVEVLKDPKDEKHRPGLFSLTKRLFSAILKEICSGKFEKYETITPVYQDEEGGAEG